MLKKLVKKSLSLFGYKIRKEGLCNSSTIYDVVVPLGYDCHQALMRDSIGIRNFSLPFDWLKDIDEYTSFDQNFMSRIITIENNFKGFLNREDFFITDVWADNPHLSVENRKTKLYFFHDFEKTNTIENQFNAVSQKYSRRIKRLYDKIAESKTILFLYTSFGTLKHSTLIEGFKSLQRKLPAKNTNLLILQHDPEISDWTFQKDLIYQNLCIYTFNNNQEYASRKDDLWFGNEKVYLAILLDIISHPGYIMKLIDENHKMRLKIKESENLCKIR